MKILYIAYSCMPNKGSEEKIGWNIPIEAAKTDEIYVVTKEEHRETIENFVAENKINNPKFYFIDIPKLYKKIYKGSAYSVRLNIWHKRAFPLVEKLCNDEKIDIIHQITPIEFRSIGAYHKIKNTHFVCGPLGGGEYLPKGLRGYAVANVHVELLRRILNFAYKTKYRITGELKNCAWFLFANYETEKYMSKLIGNTPSQLYFDNGLSESELDTQKIDEKRDDEKTIFLVAGRMAYRKGHRFLIDTIRNLPEETAYEFRFVGDGKCRKRLEGLCKKYGLEDKVVFTGRIPFSQMEEEYRNADAFVMPSIRETTGAVLLESASKSLPVITISKFGAPVLFDDDSAYLYSGDSRREYIENLRRAILECVENPNRRIEKGQAALVVVKKHLWAEKVEKYKEIYIKLLSE